MKVEININIGITCILLLFLQMVTLITCGTGTRFSSHVTINTQGGRISHGVGDPIPSSRQASHRQSHDRKLLQSSTRFASRDTNGYFLNKPKIPFNNEDNAVSPMGVWSLNHRSFNGVPISILPPSPYKIDSPDPESLWPEGLFLPPLHYSPGASARRADTDASFSEDPYLLEGSEALAAVTNASSRILYFHDFPHIESLFANQDERVRNNLKPHRIASIRQTWPFNRP